MEKIKKLQIIIDDKTIQLRKQPIESAIYIYIEGESRKVNTI